MAELKINRNIIFRFLLGIVVGGLIGFAYYYFIGCKSGTCAITSNPINSTLYGVLLGFLWTIPSKKKKGK